eukprot:665402-Prymnesium_polylepis.1
MRCYISVLRLNRPECESAIVYGFNWDLKPWAAPLKITPGGANSYLSGVKRRVRGEAEAARGLTQR